MLVRRGHRIRVEVSSSNDPRYDRNPNTGRDIPTERRRSRRRKPCFTVRRHPRESSFRSFRAEGCSSVAPARRMVSDYLANSGHLLGRVISQQDDRLGANKTTARRRRVTR